MEKQAPSGLDQLTRLYEETSAELFSYVRYRCGSLVVAEEITGQVYEEAVRQMRASEKVDFGMGWLKTVAHRRLIDHWRRDERWGRVSDALRREVLDEARGSIEPGSSDDIQLALDSLPSRQRAALILRYLDDQSVTEVAEALEIAYSAAESLLARARRSFTDAYEATGGSR